MMEPVQVVPRRIWRDGKSERRQSFDSRRDASGAYIQWRDLCGNDETPRDLEDFAVGFSLSEGVISSSADIDSLEIVPLDEGAEVRMWLAKPRADRLRERRRYIAGPTGCGLCGIESIAKQYALRPLSGPAGNSHPNRSWWPCRVYHHIKSSTSRRARYMPRPFGIPGAASLPCARTLAVITPSTSCRVH